MNGCGNFDVSTLKRSRNFLQIPDAASCSREVVYYGKDCQWMEVDGVTEEIRGSSTPLRTWNRRTARFCNIGSQEAAPGITTATIRFYEGCLSGIPLPLTLGDCAFRVVINHGLCDSSGDFLNGWSDYAEVYDFLPTQRNRGRRTSYDGDDSARVIEMTAELQNVYDIGPVSFSPLDLTIACSTGTLSAGKGSFGCSVGCADTSCGCQDSCDDGTQSIYIPIHCAGSNEQYVWFTTNGGRTENFIMMPVPSAGGTPTTTPIVQVANSTMYILAFENPTTLFAVQLDSGGNPSGTITEITPLVGTSTGGTITDGVPAEMIWDGSILHILVSDTTNGSRYYQQGGNISAADGELNVFDAAAEVTEMAACGKTVVTGGTLGALFLSVDGGSNFGTMAGPATLTGDITSIEVEDVVIRIGTSTGQHWTTTDNGFTWDQIVTVGVAQSVADIAGAGDITWLLSGGAPFSSWVGGRNGGEWTNQNPRISNWDANITAESIAMPTCASAHLLSNTVLVVGNDGTDATAHIGRTTISGI